MIVVCCTDRLKSQLKAAAGGTEKQARISLLNYNNGEITMKKATCLCGSLVAECQGEHLLHSQCSCEDCQRRTGAPSAFQLHYNSSQVKLVGSYKTYSRNSAGGRKVTTYFCPSCGSTILLSASYSEAVFGEEIFQVSVGCFHDTSIGAPDVSAWNCFLPAWMPALSAKEFQMDKQPLLIEELKQAVLSLGNKG